MNYLLPVFLAMFLLHLFYNYLVLPLLRDSLKYQLFSLRDEFRQYELDNRDILNHDIVDYMKGTVNRTIDMVETFDISILFMVKRAMQYDVQFQEAHKKYQTCFNAYATDEIRIFERRKLQIALHIFLANTFEAGLWLLPISIILNVLVFSFTVVKNLVNISINLPEKQPICQRT